MHSWVHVIYRKEDYDELRRVEELDCYKGMFFIGDFLIIEGEVKLTDRCGGTIGENNKKTLLVISHLDGFRLLDELIADGFIKNDSSIVHLSDLHPTELGRLSTRIRKGIYLGKEEFLHHLDKMKSENDYNNISLQERQKLKATGLLFMHQISKIIEGIFMHLNQSKHPQIEPLFADATSLFNALGSWVFGSASAKIVYPELKLFVKNANDIRVEDFANIIDYINWICEDLQKILEENQMNEEDYFEQYTLGEDSSAELFYMWQLGGLVIKIMDSSKELDAPILLQPFQSFTNLFKSLGKRVFAQDKSENLFLCFESFEKALEIKGDPVFDEISKDAKITHNNISRFLQDLKIKN